jgi:hypothetical protein
MTAVTEWIPYSRGLQIMAVLADMATGQAPADGLHVMAGPPNNGKTAIVDELRRRYPSSFNRAAERSHIPILALDMPPRPNITGIVRKALRSTGAPFMTGSLDRDISYVGGVLATTGTRLIVLDDAQHILTGMPSQRQLFLSFWTDVAVRANAALLLVGTARVFKLGPVIETARHLSMPAWRLDHDFGSMARALEHRLSPESSVIQAEDLPILHRVSAGRLGALVAVMMALIGQAPMPEGDLRDLVPLDLRFQRAEDAV